MSNKCHAVYGRIAAVAKKSAFSGAHARGKGGGCENGKAEQACI